MNGDTVAFKCELYKTPIFSEHRLVLNSFFASLDHLSRRCRLKRVALFIGIETSHHDHLFALCVYSVNSDRYRCFALYVGCDGKSYQASAVISYHIQHDNITESIYNYVE